MTSLGRFGAGFGLGLALLSPFTPSHADFHLMQIDEVMAGRDGDSNVQFIELQMLAEQQHCQGTGQIEDFVHETCRSTGPGARLVFFDAEGAQTGEFIFPANSGVATFGRSILIATQDFANLGVPPPPDFIMPALLAPGSGKVCYRNRDGAPFDVNLCLSYGAFTGDTEGFGPPAPALPMAGNLSLTRVNGDFGNSAYALQTPTPRNNCGQLSRVNRCLRVMKVGPVNGTVFSNPAGVDCQQSCPETSAAFSDGDVVALTALSAGGSLFTGWTGGDCSGTGSCTLTIGGDTSISAAFAEIPPDTSIAASILPSSRSVQVGTPATALATIINAGGVTARSCSIGPGAFVPGSFLFLPTDAVTAAPSGPANTPIDIPGGRAQNFVFAFTPSGSFGPTDVPVAFLCANAEAPFSIPGLNTLLLSASPTPVPDIVALAATIDHDGIVKIPGPNGIGVLQVAAANVGTAGTITVSADTGFFGQPVTALLCEVDAASPVGACRDTPTPTVTTTIAAGATSAFAVFVLGGGNVGFDPAFNRLFVRFSEGDVTRGSTSVAIVTVP